MKKDLTEEQKQAIYKRRTRKYGAVCKKCGSINFVKDGIRISKISTKPNRQILKCECGTNMTVSMTAGNKVVNYYKSIRQVE